MEIVEKAALIVAGMSVRAHWQALWTEVPQAWRELLARAGEIEHRVGATFLDVSLDQYGDEYRQLVGAQVARVDRVPASMVAIEIPAQAYVHHRHRGPTRGIAASFGAIYAWAHERGVATGEFKLDLGYTAAGDEREHDLFVALAPGEAWRELAVPA